MPGVRPEFRHHPPDLSSSSHLSLGEAGRRTRCVLPPVGCCGIVPPWHWSRANPRLPTAPWLWGLASLRPCSQWFQLPGSCLCPPAGLGVPGQGPQQPNLFTERWTRPASVWAQHAPQDCPSWNPAAQPCSAPSRPASALCLPVLHPLGLSLVSLSVCGCLSTSVPSSHLPPWPILHSSQSAGGTKGMHCPEVHGLAGSPPREAWPPIIRSVAAPWGHACSQRPDWLPGLHGLRALPPRPPGTCLRTTRAAAHSSHPPLARWAFTPGWWGLYTLASSLSLCRICWRLRFLREAAGCLRAKPSLNFSWLFPSDNSGQSPRQRAQAGDPQAMGALQL